MTLSASSTPNPSSSTPRREPSAGLVKSGATRPLRSGRRGTHEPRAIAASEPRTGGTGPSPSPRSGPSGGANGLRPESPLQKSVFQVRKSPFPFRSKPQEPRQ